MRVLIAIGLVLVVGPSWALDWPQWRGADRSGRASETGLLRDWQQAPPLRYTASGLGVGFSSVAIAGGRVYTMGDVGEDQFVIALAANDGKILWRTRIGPRWEDRYGGPRGTPTVAGQHVYALGTEGDLVCLEAASGRVVWRKNLVDDFGGRMMSSWKFVESPLVDGDRVVVTPGAGGAALVALDRLGGREIWRTALPHLGPNGLDGAGYASIVISEGAGVKQYVQLMGRGLVGVRARDGKFLWNYNRIANDVANVPTPITSGDLVFTSSGYNTGAALVRLRRSGEPAAELVAAEEVYFLPPNTLQNHHGGLVLVNGHVYGGHGQNRGFPICVELQGGAVVWGGSLRNEGSGSAAVTYADGHLYYRYQNGLMVLIEATPAGYRQKGSFEIPGVTQPSWSHPVVDGGALYLREQDALHVYDLRSSR